MNIDLHDRIPFLKIFKKDTRNTKLFEKLEKKVKLELSVNNIFEKSFKLNFLLNELFFRESQYDAIKQAGISEGWLENACFDDSVIDNKLLPSLNIQQPIENLRINRLTGLEGIIDI